MGMRGPPPAHGGNLSAFMAARWRSKWRRGGVFQIPQKPAGGCKRLGEDPRGLGLEVQIQGQAGQIHQRGSGGIAGGWRQQHPPGPIPQHWEHPTGAVQSRSHFAPGSIIDFLSGGLPDGRLRTAGFSRAQRFLVLKLPGAAQIGRQLEGIQTKPHQHRIAEQIVGIERSIQKMASATPARDGVRRGDVERLRDHRVPKFRKQLCLRELWRRFDSKPLPRRSS